MKKNKKVSIVMSGGSIKGAYEVGMLKTLRKYINFDKDILAISGTSVGSLNGSMLATGNKGFERLLKVWDTIKKPKHMIKKWAWGIPVLSQIVGFFKGGIYSFSPIEKIVKREVGQALLDSDIHFYSCSVDMVTGDKIYGYNKDKNNSVSDMQKYVIASASMAPAFKPIHLKNMWLTDGGCKEPVPVKAIAEKFKDSEYIIILLTRPLETRDKMKPKGNLYQVASRNVDFLFDEVFSNDVEIGLRKYWEGKKFIVVAPDKKIFKDSLDIDGVKIQEAIREGERIGDEAFKVLKNFNK